MPENSQIILQVCGWGILITGILIFVVGNAIADFFDYSTYQGPPDDVVKGKEDG